MKWQHFWWLMVAILIIAAAFLLSLFKLPFRVFFCPFRWLTHLPCPFCGLTTSFVYMARFKLGAAFCAHPLGPLLFLLTLSQIPYRLYFLVTNKRSWRFNNAGWVIWAIFILLLGSWAFKLW